MNELEPQENGESNGNGNGNGGGNRLLLGAIVGLVGLLVVGLGLLGYIVMNRSGGVVPAAPTAAPTATAVAPTTAPATVAPAAPTAVPTKAATATPYVPGGSPTAGTGSQTPVSASASTATAVAASAATSTAVSKAAGANTPGAQSTPVGGGDMPQTGAGQLPLLAGMGLVLVVLTARLIRTRGRV